MRKKAAYIFILRILRLGLSVLNLSFSARYFGVSAEKDVWLLALNAVLIFDMAIWGPINETFRAKFLFIKDQEGEALALQQTRSLLLFTNLVTLMLVIGMMVFAPQIATLFAPEYRLEERTALILMIRVVAPTFLLNQVTKLLASVLNAYHSFIIPEITGLITQLFTLVLFISLAPVIGIYTLVISYYGGLLLLLFLLSRQIRKLNISLFQRFFQSNLQGAWPFVLFSLPFFMPYFAAQVNLVIEKSLASRTGVGAISILDYARKFSDIPLDSLTGIFSSLLVPVLSIHFLQQRKTDFLIEFRKIYQFGFLILAVIVALLSARPGMLVGILYNQGGISAASLEEIASLARLYSWAAFAIFLYITFGLVLISIQKGWLYAALGTFTQLLMITLNLSLFPSFSIYTFPLALMAAHFVGAGLMALFFPYKRAQLQGVTLQYTAVVVLVAAVLYGLNQWLPLENPFLLLPINLFLLALLLLLALFAFRLEERLLVLGYLKKIKGWM